MNISNSEHPVIQAVPGVHAGPDTGGLEVILFAILGMLMCIIGVLSAVYVANKDCSKKSKARAEALCECGEGRGGGGGGDSGMSKKLIEAVKGSEGL